MLLFYSRYPAHEPSVYQIVSLEIESDHTRFTSTLFFLSELYNQHKLSVGEVRWILWLSRFLNFMFRIRFVMIFLKKMKVLFAILFSSYNQVCFMDNIHKINRHFEKNCHRMELYLFVRSFNF